MQPKQLLPSTRLDEKLGKPCWQIFRRKCSLLDRRISWLLTKSAVDGQVAAEGRAKHWVAVTKRRSKNSQRTARFATASCLLGKSANAFWRRSKNLMHSLQNTELV